MKRERSSGRDALASRAAMNNRAWALGGDKVHETCSTRESPHVRRKTPFGRSNDTLRHSKSFSTAEMMFPGFGKSEVAALAREPAASGESAASGGPIASGREVASGRSA